MSEYTERTTIKINELRKQLAEAKAANLTEDVTSQLEKMISKLSKDLHESISEKQILKG